MMNRKTALITAGASGIGLVTVEHLARDGWHVIVGDIDANAGARTAERLGVGFRLADMRVPGARCSTVSGG